MQVAVRTPNAAPMVFMNQSSVSQERPMADTSACVSSMRTDKPDTTANTRKGRRKSSVAKRARGSNIATLAKVSTPWNGTENWMVQKSSGSADEGESVRTRGPRWALNEHCRPTTQLESPAQVKDE